MFDLSAAFGTNEQSVEEGVKFQLDDSSYLLIARMPNSRYRRELSLQVERNSRVLDLKTAESEKLNSEIMVDVIAKTVLLGWEGITQDGKKLEYSTENAKAMLMKYDDFRKVVTDFASDINNYRQAQEEETIKK